jgi:hypothetical protein
MLQPHLFQVDLQLFSDQHRDRIAASGVMTTALPMIDF